MDTHPRLAIFARRRRGRDSRFSFSGKRLWRTFSSLKLAVILIIALAVASVLGTLLPQLPSGTAADPKALAQWLTAARDKYGPLASLYWSLGLFDVFHAPWFLLLLAALTLNTIVCTINRFKAVWRAVTQVKVHMPDVFFERVPDRATLIAPSPLASACDQEAIAGVRAVLARRRYRVLAQSEGETTYLYADRNRLARFGTLITHISLILILGGALWGGAFGWREDEVVLKPGQAQELGHGLPFQVRCDKFEIQRYPNGMPRDYRGHLVVLEGGREVLRKRVRVNEPLDYRGVSLYLASYGPAVRAHVTDASGQPLALQTTSSGGSSTEAILTFTGEGDEAYVLVPSRGLALRVTYQPRATPGLEGSPLFVQGFYGSQAQPLFAGLVPQGELWTWGDLRFEFIPDHYTVFMAVHDPGFAPLITAGFLMLVGLILSFYFPHYRVWARVTGEGEIRLAGLTDKHQEDFTRHFAALTEEMGKGLGNQGIRG